MIEHLDGFERYLKVFEGKEPTTTSAYLAKVKEFCTWCVDNGRSTDPAELNRRDIEAFLEACFYKGNKNITRFTKLTALTKFFRYLAYEGKIDDNITARIPRPKIRRKFVQMFNKEEVLRFFRQVDITSEKGLRDAVILILLAFCGLRDGEIVSLTMNDIADKGKSFDINVVDSKTDSGTRQVYLWKAPSMFIRQYYTIRLGHGAKINDPLLVSYRRGGSTVMGNALNQSNINHLIKKLAQRAGIRKAQIKPHMFRATHINDLRNIKGYDLPAIAERVGHKHISTTDRYIPRRERIHRTYNSLHEYWIDFVKIWTKEDDAEQAG